MAPMTRREILQNTVGLVAAAAVINLPSAQAALATSPATAADAPDGKLHIVALGAHPDDAEINSGGSGALWAKRGDHVEMVSVTNGDLGHFAMSGGALAQRRVAEVKKASEILGTTSFVFDIHDGELMPTLENRREMTRVIRRWKADVVIGHRPNDYHPDHRYVGVLMQDCAYMLNVPFFCPDVPALTKMPLFLYAYDKFQHPSPFRADIVVNIDSVMDKKLAALLTMESQFVEGGALAKPNPALKDAAELTKKRKEAEDMFRKWHADIANQFREKLIEVYGPAIGKKVRYAEAFQVCEYGRPYGFVTKLVPTREELRQWFPFLPE